MKCRFYLFLFLFFLPQSKIFAQQQEFVFKNYTQEEGLPSNETYYVFEDSRHYLWIGTDLGVVRYNGSKFELFNLPDNVVFKIKEDSRGRVWFFTHKAQLAYFENEEIHLFKYNDRILKRMEKIHITEAYIDDADNIILNSSLDSNYTISANGLITAFRHDVIDHDPSLFRINFIRNNIPFVQKIRGSRFGADTMLFEVNQGNRGRKYSIPVSHLPFTHYGSITTNGHDIFFFGGKMLIKLSEDGSWILKQMPNKILCLNKSAENIWVGMIKNGAVLLGPDLEKKIGDTVLTDKSISSITTDYEGGRWFSTLENGLFYIKNTNIIHLTNPKVPNPFVARLMNVKDSVLVYSTTKGLYKLSGNENTLLADLRNSNLADMFMGKNKTIYCFGGIEKYNHFAKINDPWFKYLYAELSPSEAVEFENKDSLVTSVSNGVIIANSSYIHKANTGQMKFDSNFILHFKTILGKPAKLFKDRKDNIWGGTNDGLYKANAAYDTMLKFKASAALLNKGVNCIRQMDNGMLVTAVRFAGVVLLNDTNIVANITEAEGLLSNKVRYLLPLKNQLWVATAKGISVVSFTSYQPLEYMITNIGKNDGFYNVTINQLIQYQGQIVAATSNGIYFIDNSTAFLTKELPDIPFFISSVSSFRGDTSGINSITLPYYKNRLLIKYNAVCFNSYEAIKYLYRFEKTDTNWHSTINPELLMENLQPGIYNLQIKAVIPNQQRTSSTQVFTIIVEKPWWQNNWFRIGAILALAAAVYLFITTRIRKIQEQERNKTLLNSRMAELEQTALRSQMNPHFIFNCLTSIQQLIVSGHNIDANEYLVKFARLIRKTLELSARSFISIREEMEYLNEYLFLEQLRLSGQFEFTISTDANIEKDRVQIPNMMIQPVVENCIRHGIKSLEGRKGLITVLFEQSENYITCTVTDNGIGRTSSNTFNNNAFTEHKSYGVDIVRKRLKTFTGLSQQDTGIDIRDLYDAAGTSAGTQVVIQLPFKKIKS